MDQDKLRTLKLLEAIDSSEPPTQRELARDLNISLGLVNAFVKRLAKKGYFKITTIPKKRAKYLLTPKGAMAKSVELTFATHAPGADLVIVSPNDPGAMNSYVSECKALGLAYIYDPSQQTIRLTADELLCGLDGCALLTVNEYELSLIQEKTGLTLEKILSKCGPG